MSAKEKYRQMMKLFPATHSQSHIMNLINDLGIEYEEKLPNHNPGQMKACFANASYLALDCPWLTYCEGYAFSPHTCGLGVEHAWCIDQSGRVKDVTWLDPENCEYLGIPIPTNMLREQLHKTGEYGLFTTKHRPNTEFISKVRSMMERA